MSLNKVGILCIILIICAEVSSIDYCRKNRCPNPRKHVLCLHPPKSETKCEEWKIHKKGITEDQGTSIMKVHDGFRKRLDGSSLPPLEWDFGLAGMAQVWAEQCPTREDECRSLIRINKPRGRRTVFPAVFQKVLFNQEIYKGVGTIDWPTVMSVWFDEEFKSELKFMEQIGCGLAIFSRSSSLHSLFITPEPEYRLYLVCNYLKRINK